jgi:hypothetical protein
VVIASGWNADVGVWSATARVVTNNTKLGRGSSLGISTGQFHKMNDYALRALQHRYETLVSSNRAKEFDYTMADLQMENPNAALIQVRPWAPLLQSAPSGLGICSIHVSLCPKLVAMIVILGVSFQICRSTPQSVDLNM